MADDMSDGLPPVLRLPAELLHQVLGYLEPDDLARVAPTCKRLHQHSYDDQLWQPLINRNLFEPIAEPVPLKSFRDLYVAHQPNWFLPQNQIWFADSKPSGKLLVSRYDPREGSIVAHTVVASRGSHTLESWEQDPEVIIHSFHPRVSLDLERPVLKLDVDSPKTDDQSSHNPSDRAYGPSSRYSKEVLMETFVEAGLYSSFMLCRKLPDAAISETTNVWPPTRFPADSRARNVTHDGYNSTGHRPTKLSEISQNTFRLRKWVEYSGRRANPTSLPFNAHNGISAAFGLASPYLSAALAGSGGGMNFRMPEDITTYATLPEWAYKPTPEKPWQGIWCGDYSGHGCEFIVIRQPDKEDEQPLPREMARLRQWFNNDSLHLDDGWSDMDSDEEVPSAIDTTNAMEPAADEPEASRPGHPSANDHKNAPTGRLEAIKLTGDINIPRGEYTFVAPDIGHEGFIRIAEEEIFRGARVVKSAGHIAERHFENDSYIRTQLIMISHDTLAQFWEGFDHFAGNISYYKRVDLDALLRMKASA